MLDSAFKNARLVGLILLGIMLVNCSGGRKVSTSQIRAIESKLDQAYNYWKGTSYRLGGESKNGIDCSALLMIVMKDQFGVKIPRTTHEQIDKGLKVSPRNLMPGDFVFFKTGANTLHVGILIRPGKFMHASTSQGVTISELNNPYWRSRIIGYRRFM